MMLGAWPTQEQDLLAAADIIARHTRFHGAYSLGVFQWVADSGVEELESMQGPVGALSSDLEQLRISDWCSEIFNHFIDYYGYEHGYAVGGMVLTKLLLKKEVLH